MTISRERFQHLVVQALSANGKGKWESIADMVSDAHALIKAIEQEAEVVGYMSQNGFLEKSARWKHGYPIELIALPLVEGETN